MSHASLPSDQDPLPPTQSRPTRRRRRLGPQAPSFQGETGPTAFVISTVAPASTSGPTDARANLPPTTAEPMTVATASSAAHHPRATPLSRPLYLLLILSILLSQLCRSTVAAANSYSSSSSSSPARSTSQSLSSSRSSTGDDDTPAQFGPLTLRDSVRAYLASRRGRRLHRSLALPHAVLYDPTHILLHESGAPLWRRSRAYARHFPSDLQLLRALALPVPGVDADADVRAWVARQSVRCGDTADADNRLTVVGSRSTFEVSFSAGAPAVIREPVRLAVRQWAERFRSSVTVRVCLVWTDIPKDAGGEGGGGGGDAESSTLGATSVPFVSSGRAHPNLRPNVVYHPALASALTGRDQLGGGQAHVRIMLNRRINWHVNTATRAPEKKFDMATTVLHELTHGLFMSGTLQRTSRGGTYGIAGPSRFDEFIQAAGRVGIARACRDDPGGLLEAMVGGGLRFFDAQSRVDLGLYAPATFEPGSSVYHLDKNSLKADCARYNLGAADCSDLMTHELLARYTQRNLGRTTLMLYEAMRSLAPGPGAGGPCTNLTVLSAPAQAEEDGGGVFRLETWMIATVAGLAAIGVLLVIGVAISALKRPS